MKQEVTDRGCGRPFEGPIEIAGGKLVTLLDAGHYIAALPKKEHEAPEWQAAMEALILVAERGGPTLFARIGVMRALNRHYVPAVKPEGKTAALGAAQAEEGSVGDDTRRQKGPHRRLAGALRRRAFHDLPDLRRTA